VTEFKNNKIICPHNDGGKANREEWKTKYSYRESTIASDIYRMVYSVTITIAFLTY